MAEDTIQSVARAFSILEQLAAQGEMGVGSSTALPDSASLRSIAF